jgi:hypothetical protein
MAVFIEANYSKKLGLPNFSSHQYSVTLRTEISDLSQLEKANAELYAKLQAAVDTQILIVGVLPDGKDGKSQPPARSQQPVRTTPSAPVWKCSDKQRDLILKMISEHTLDTANIDALAMERFGVGLQQLNKVQASGLIGELMETYGKSGRQSYAGRNGR